MSKCNGRRNHKKNGAILIYELPKLFIAQNEKNIKIIIAITNFHFKVAWLRVDTQTILTIQNNVITKNHRVGISFTEKKAWHLRLKDVRETDKGW